MLEFDPDGVLISALALSRYIALNAHGIEIAARRVELPSRIEVVAVPPANRFYAWSVRDGSRTHLTHDDAVALAALLGAYFARKDRLPPRVRNAIWHCEHSFRTRYYGVAHVHVVTAFDSLTGVHSRDASRQFRTRVPALARELGLVGMTMRRAGAFYRRRSRSVHGQSLRLDAFDPATRELAAMQRLLTGVLRKAIEDPAFGSLLTGPRIERRWRV